jgi:hypothetical protein
MKKLTIILILLAGCVGPPGVAPPVPKPWYTVNKDLAAKAASHRTSTLRMLDESGLLLYKPYLPWGDDPQGRSNYILSHDIADAPAWHGMLMQALAYEWAVTGESNDALLRKMAGALIENFEVTGTPGLLSRSYIGNYTGERKPWMETPEERPTKFWMQDEQGRWFRNGLAKNHMNMAMCGCALPLALHRRGDIQLSSETEAALKSVLVAGVTHLAGGDWRIRDWDGRFTEFGDLRPNVTFGPTWPELKNLPNGFNQMLVLNMLRSAAYYDDDLKQIYEEVAPKWAPGIKQSLEVAGEAVKMIGHWKIGKPSYSDMQAFSTAAACFMLQEERREIVRYVTGGLHGLWEYMRWENNPPFNLAYHMARPNESNMPAIERLLRHFPDVDGKQAYEFKKKATDKYQPIENRPPNSVYWKSSPFRLAVSVGPSIATNPDTGDRQIFSGADYLYAYHMGRFLDAIPAR